MSIVSRHGSSLSFLGVSNNMWAKLAHTDISYARWNDIWKANKRNTVPTFNRKPNSNCDDVKWNIKNKKLTGWLMFTTKQIYSSSRRKNSIEKF